MWRTSRGTGRERGGWCQAEAVAVAAEALRRRRRTTTTAPAVAARVSGMSAAAGASGTTAAGAHVVSGTIGEKIAAPLFTDARVRYSAACLPAIETSYGHGRRRGVDRDVLGGRDRRPQRRAAARGSARRRVPGIVPDEGGSASAAWPVSDVTRAGERRRSVIVVVRRRCIARAPEHDLGLQGVGRARRRRRRWRRPCTFFAVDGHAGRAQRVVVVAGARGQVEDLLLDDGRVREGRAVDVPAQLHGHRRPRALRRGWRRRPRCGRCP